MQDEMLRHHLIMHASMLDMFSKVREEVQDIATARDAAGGVVPVQTGAVKGEGQGRQRQKGELMQAEKESDDAEKQAEKNKDTHTASSAKGKVTTRAMAETASVT